MTYQPKHLDRWTSADPYTGEKINYFGPDMSEYYLAPIFRSRDSGALARSNWRVIQPQLEALGAETHRFGHWACGWYERVLIHQDNEECLRKADEWACALADYPVADDEDFSDLEYEEAHQWWKDMGLRERVCLCARAGLSIFAARRDDQIPESSYIWDHLTAA